MDNAFVTGQRYFSQNSNILKKVLVRALVDLSSLDSDGGPMPPEILHQSGPENSGNMLERGWGRCGSASPVFGSMTRFCLPRVEMSSQRSPEPAP
jgi:hypothetical protein